MVVGLGGGQVDQTGEHPAIRERQDGSGGRDRARTATTPFSAQEPTADLSASIDDTGTQDYHRPTTSRPREECSRLTCPYMPGCLRAEFQTASDLS